MANCIINTLTKKTIKTLIIIFSISLIFSCGSSGGDDSSNSTSNNSQNNNSNNQDNQDSNNQDSSNQKDITVNGIIDSSFINILGTNKVLIFQGEVSNNQITSGLTPDKTALITQNSETLKWEYSISEITSGSYTLATLSSDSDFSTGSETATIQKSISSSVDSSVENEINFEAENIITVGPSGDYPTPSAAYPHVEDGDVVEIEAATYENDIVVWRQNNIILRGVNGRPKLLASNQIEYEGSNDVKNGKAIWVIRGDNVKVENIEFANASVPDKNGAGIRHEGDDLYVSNCYFHNNENGILGGNGLMVIEYSEFSNNGYGDGYSHNLYISQRVTKLVFRYNYTHHAHIGHNLKSRAANNIIRYNRIMDEVTGDSSYGIDLPNGGQATIVGNVIQQGTDTDNSKIISYGAEGLTYETNSLNIVNNTMVNDRSTGTFIRIAGDIDTNITNNLFIGNGSLISGTANENNNLHFTEDPGLADKANFDYHLTSSITTAINSGISQDSELTPIYEYRDTARYTQREDDGSIDIGAYEF